MNYRIPVTISYDDKQLERVLGLNYVPEMKSVRFEKPPVLDGKKDKIWETAAKTGNFVCYDKVLPAEKQTEVRLGYDERCLYLLFQCSEPDPVSLKRTVQNRDGKIWDDDCVEFYLGQTGTKNEYYHFMLNSGNIQRDEFIGADSNGDVTWDGKWDSHVTINPDNWIAEFSIPWMTLGFKSPPPVLKGNFNRQESAKGELSGWSCTYGSFLNPERFGVIILPDPF